MASTPMDVDAETPPGDPPQLNITRTLGANIAATSQVHEVIANFRPTKLFKRDDAKDNKTPFVLSIDYDDPGELCMTSESDETIQIYNVREGRHDKTLLSKKYGAKLAKFTHASSSIIYASTKQNDAIRYLATHDNSFIRYFEGHQGSVTCLAMHPGTDNFISCSRDNTVRLWDISTKFWTAQLNLRTPCLAAYDPSGKLFAVASSSSGSILLYDHQNLVRPVSIFDVVEKCHAADTHSIMQGWTKLEFSNDGKHILLGTNGKGHFLLDAFTCELKAFLRKPEGGVRRAPPGEVADGRNAPAGTPQALDTSGECCFTPDGRYVLSGSRKDVLIWDVLSIPSDGRKELHPTHVLEDKKEAAVLAYNPRFNFFATADQHLQFWLPDPHV
ncbi:WD40 repeat-like protein [Cryphonectria parasitica EP155]|uniref:WD40 repeat-like protein n=1 Tax=Cryphonectria parasitica (strain ATCC 38755 / EP155) TaxID=660469 RepID=A0A9P4YAJ8_CRYP1|nr:WD40 repeat-like protein [Cryphonectria parasitica EP155]KAF3769972.1 WD40 repeat-like protein [Cryphonectria parasitica EP155]